MTIRLFASLFVNGVTMGMIYAMIAMGLILLIKAVGVLNFAQGDLLMIGAYITCAFATDLSMPLYAMLPTAFVSFALLGIAFMLGTYWPLRKASYPVAPIIATMGASLVLSEGAVILFGSWPRTMPNLVKNAAGKVATFNLFGTKIQYQYILIILAACLAMYLVYMLFERSYVGRMMQAAAQDKPAAELIGISTLFTTGATYMLVVVLIGFAGYMVAPIYTVTPSLSSLQLRAFAGTVIGGFGSIKGAILGCLLVGLTEAFATVSFSSYKDAVVFMVLILFLLLRPQGIVKSRIGDKA